MPAVEAMTGCPAHQGREDTRAIVVLQLVAAPAEQDRTNRQNWGRKRLARAEPKVKARFPRKFQVMATQMASDRDRGREKTVSRTVNVRRPTPIPSNP